MRSEGDLSGEQPPGLASVGTGAAGDDPAELGGVHHDLFTARAEAPDPAGGAGELEPVGLSVPSGPLSHDVCDDDAVVVGGEYRGSTRRPGEVQAVHPRVASEDHIGHVSERPFLRYTVDDFCPR